MVSSDRRAFLLGASAGAAVALSLALLYDRLVRKRRTGRFQSPTYGLQNVRVRHEESLRITDGDLPSGGRKDGGAAASSLPPAAKEDKLKKTTSVTAADLPADFRAKHPKGVGVDMVKTDVKVTEVLMLPVPNLGEFYESRQTLNELGTGIVHDYSSFTTNQDVILGDIVRKQGMAPVSRAYLRAGPRKALYFNPSEVRAAIVTCGGLCPGLNNIIRETTKALLNLYGAAAVYGVRGGYWGFHEKKGEPPLLLTHDVVTGIQHLGGTILGSARGGYDLEEVFGFCKRHQINQLYVVGGDGTHRAANKIGLEALQRKANIAVAGIPKTIDNDLDLVDRTFGFNSAVMAAQDAIRSAAVEARCNKPNGIGVVKLMGRHAGFIAAHATLASGEVDLCLIPEVPIELEGPYGVLPHIERVLKAKGKAVVVLAEGAGEELVGASAGVDAGGNKKLPEFGPFFKDTLNSHFKGKGIEVNVKYIDPSYMVRSVPANASDSLFCMLLAQNAVHGAMAGYTCFTTGLCCNRTVYLPIPALVENSPRKMDKAGRTWERIISVTGQPNRPVDKAKDAAGQDHAVQPATIF